MDYRRLLPLFLVISSLAVGVSGFRFYLSEYANQFGVEFKAQNIAELSSADIFKVSARLNSLSDAINWVCLSASRNGHAFLEKSRGSCGSMFWQEEVKVDTPEVEGLSVKLTIRLPLVLEIVWLSLVVIQGLLLFTLIFSAKKQENERVRFLEDKYKLEVSLGQLAAQVSHDIRSPLASLISISQHAIGLDPASKSQLLTTVNRIQSIANNLLEKNQRVLRPIDSSGIPAVSSELLLVETLVSNVDSVFTEKCTQYRDRPGLEIHADLDRTVFSEIQPVEFSRAISNLIDNSVEAGATEIKVLLESRDGRAVVEILDNGKGIAPEILARLGQRGETHGKEGGTGLGIFHAKSLVESWGGALTIRSMVGQGTTVTLTLTQAAAPRWFVSDIEIPSGATVVVADDDETIHQIWKQKLPKHAFACFVKTPDQLLGWYRENAGSSEQPTLYLCDHDFGPSHSKNGLEIIEMLGIAQESILVTGRADEPAIRERCDRFGIRLLPKESIAKISVR